MQLNRNKHRDWTEASGVKSGEDTYCTERTEAPAGEESWAGQLTAAHRKRSRRRKEMEGVSKTIRVKGMRLGQSWKVNYQPPCLWNATGISFLHQMRIRPLASFTFNLQELGKKREIDRTGDWSSLFILWLLRGKLLPTTFWPEGTPARIKTSASIRKITCG